MKNTVKIASISFNDEFVNAKDIKQHTLNILLTENIIRGSLVKVNPDDKDDDITEKILKKSDRFTIDFKEFLKMLVLNDKLGQLDPKKVDKTEDMSWKEEQQLKYRIHLKRLRGATITIDREEIKDTKYKLKDGDIMLDDDGNPIPEVDKDGNPIKSLVGFGETSIVELKLTPTAEELLTEDIKKQDE